VYTIDPYCDFSSSEIWVQTLDNVSWCSPGLEPVASSTCGGVGHLVAPSRELVRLLAVKTFLRCVGVTDLSHCVGS